MCTQLILAIDIQKNTFILQVILISALKSILRLFKYSTKLARSPQM